MNKMREVAIEARLTTGLSINSTFKLRFEFS